MPIVEAPDGKIIEFPDSMGEPEINRVMALQYPAPVPAAPQPSAWSQFGSTALNVGKEIVQAPSNAIDAALGLMSSAVNYPISRMGGYGRGMYEAVIGNPDWAAKAKETQTGMEQAMAFPFQSESSRQAASLIAPVAAAPFTAITYPTRKAGEMLTEAGYPNAGYTMNLSGEVLGGAFLPKAVPAVLDTGAKMTNALIGNAPERLAASAVKMPLSKKWVRVRGEGGTSQVKQAVETMLDERIRPSEFGLAETKAGRIEAGKAVEQAVGRTEGTASLDNIVSNGLQKARERAMNGDNPLKELEAINTYEEGFKTSRNSNLTPQELQKIKVELADRINWDKTSGTADALVETMRKGIAHEARLKLEELNPELKGLNQKDAGFILLDEALERSLARRGNRDIIDLGTKVLLGREAWPFAIINATIGHPQVKATVAFMLDRARTAARERMLGKTPSGYSPRNIDQSFLQREADQAAFTSPVQYGESLVPQGSQGLVPTGISRDIFPTRGATPMPSSAEMLSRHPMGNLAVVPTGIKRTYPSSVGGETLQMWPQGGSAADIPVRMEPEFVSPSRGKLSIANRRIEPAQAAGPVAMTPLDRALAIIRNKNTPRGW
jgi:hypothetical protein